MDSGDTVGFKSARAGSTVKYVDRLEEEDLDGMYAGRFVGDGATDEDVPLAAIGLWHLWTAKRWQQRSLQGSCWVLGCRTDRRYAGRGTK